MMKTETYLECASCEAINESGAEVCVLCNSSNLKKCYEITGIPLEGSQPFRFDTELATRLNEFANREVTIRIIPR